MSDLYKKAGVDVAKGEELVSWLQKDSRQVGHTSPFGRVLSGIGGFASLYQVNFSKLKNPAIVSSTDGVGTKLLLGLDAGLLDGLGIDLVAMCINDLYTLGATPLFFLDYFATGKLEKDQFQQVLTGIKAGLAQANCALIGGETAELPGLYDKGHFDLAGFVVGVIDTDKALGKDKVKDGDVVYALPSSGFHSNGYSMLRKIMQDKPSLKTTELIQKLLTPTRIYHEILKLIDLLPSDTLHACAHITGGGISGNVPRVLPPGATCNLQKSAIKTPDWMKQFISEAGYDLWQLESVFNLGLGMVLFVDAKNAEAFDKAAEHLKCGAYRIGSLQLNSASIVAQGAMQNTKVNWES